VALALNPACRGPRPAAGRAPPAWAPTGRGPGESFLAAGSGGRSRTAGGETGEHGEPGPSGSSAGQGGAAGGASDGHSGEHGDADPEPPTRTAAGQAGAEAGAGATPGRATSPFAVVTCVALPAEGECTLSGEGAELLLRGDVLAPGTVLLGGAVRVDASGVITCTGCECDGPGARELACPGAVISPAFVNPHDHVAYAGEAPRPATPERYEHRHDWRLGLHGHEALAYEGGAPAVVRAAHELRMLLGGATVVAGGAGYRGLVRNPDLSGLAEGLPTAPADSATFPLDDGDGRLLSSGCAYGTGHARASDVERVGAYLAHLGEGIDREAENELDCALAPDFGLIEASTAVVHAVAVRAASAAALGARHAQVVWSPRSNLALYGNTAPIPLLVRSGVEVALGTDWLLTGSMNLLRELDCARRVSATYFDGLLDDHALWSMVTSAAARSVGAGSALGRLARGYVADIAVIARRGREPFTAAVAANPEDFELILRGGSVLYGREGVVAALRPGACEALEVCGAEQRVCVAESGFSLADLEAAADATYPLFACEAPPNEPSCVPARPLEYDGTPSGEDHDGDGLGDAFDLCPTVFDPLRPLDAGTQADADGDGQGDACDPCPLEPTADCVDRRSGDRDADGVADGKDDCPDREDPDQADADGDGRGDACDFCAGENPGILPCSLAIAQVREPLGPNRPPRHALLELSDAVVTATRPDTGNAHGFYLEDRPEPYSGLFVYTGEGSADVVLGDRVIVQGRFDEYQGVDQLVLGTLVARREGPPPAPLEVEAGDIGDGGSLAAACDSMLVRIAGAEVLETNPDAPSDYDETRLSGELRLDDLLLPELDNPFLPGTRFSALTGIAGTSFDHRKLWPRSLSELEP